jgi:cell division transport system ATP-binding protein
MESTTPIAWISEGRVYQNDHLVLQDVSLQIFQGAFVYLIGKTGTGKSSLLKVLYGALPLRAGRGEVAGFDLARLSRREVPFLRRRLGIVFQDFQLLSDRTVTENLYFVMRATGWKQAKAMQERAEFVLDLVGLKTKHYKMPMELSGGEQQRVGIARALINDPELILADEPTGNLDPEVSEDILRLLFNISKNGKAVLMATHDYRLIERYPSKILKVANGRLSELQLEA